MLKNIDKFVSAQQIWSKSVNESQGNSVANSKAQRVPLVKIDEKVSVRWLCSEACATPIMGHPSSVDRFSENVD